MSEAEKLLEIQRLLDEAYDHYFDHSDGHCKSSEGWVSVSFGTYFDRRDKDWPRGKVKHVQVYSYVLGPSRTHDFDSLDEALKTVRAWHTNEMTHSYEEGEW